MTPPNTTGAQALSDEEALLNRVTQLMRAIDAYAYDYQKLGKVTGSRHEVQCALSDALKLAHFEGQHDEQRATEDGARLAQDARSDASAIGAARGAGANQHHHDRTGQADDHRTSAECDSGGARVSGEGQVREAAAPVAALSSRGQGGAVAHSELLSVIHALMRDTKDYGQPELVSKRWAEEVMRKCSLAAPGAAVAAREQEATETLQAKVDRTNLRLTRRFTRMWHAEAVRLGYDGVGHMLEAIAASREQQPFWSGWACQYPGKMPRLYGAREIAEVNCDRDNGDRLLFLASREEASAASVERECNNGECGWRGVTDRMLGSIGPLCPDCGETTDAAPEQSAKGLTMGGEDAK